MNSRRCVLEGEPHIRGEDLEIYTCIHVSQNSVNSRRCVLEGNHISVGGDLEIYTCIHVSQNSVNSRRCVLEGDHISVGGIGCIFIFVCVLGVFLGGIRDCMRGNLSPKRQLELTLISSTAWLYYSSVSDDAAIEYFLQVNSLVVAFPPPCL